MNLISESVPMMFTANGFYVALATAALVFTAAPSALRRNEFFAVRLFYISPFAITASLAAARIMYVVFNLSLFTSAEQLLDFSSGGYCLYGAFAGAVAAVALWCVATKNREDMVPILDTVAAPAALAVAVGRFGSFFSGDCYGVFVENPAFCRFPFAVYVEAYDSYCLAVFFYESLCCLLLWGFLLSLSRRRHRRGEVFIMFLLLYAGLRAFLESMRTDSVYLGFVRVSQVISALILIVCFIVFSTLRVRRGGFCAVYLISYVLFACALAGGFAAEFYMGSSSYVRNYIALAVCCTAMTALAVCAYRGYLNTDGQKKKPGRGALEKPKYII